MIQTFTITAPLGQVDPDAATATLSASMARVTHLHPALRAATVQAAEGVLTLTLRVAGKTRWHGSGDARKIASSMLYRVGIPAAGAAMQLMEVAPSLNSLTKAQGRSVTPRGPKLDSAAASQDPS
jgi:hypothetical protein